MKDQKPLCLQAQAVMDAHHGSRWASSSSQLCSHRAEALITECLEFGVLLVFLALCLHFSLLFPPTPN